MPAAGCTPRTISRRATGTEPHSQTGMATPDSATRGHLQRAAAAARSARTSVEGTNTSIAADTAAPSSTNGSASSAIDVPMTRNVCMRAASPTSPTRPPTITSASSARIAITSGRLTLPPPPRGWARRPQTPTTASESRPGSARPIALAGVVHRLRQLDGGHRPGDERRASSRAADAPDPSGAARRAPRTAASTTGGTGRSRARSPPSRHVECHRYGESTVAAPAGRFPVRAPRRRRPVVTEIVVIRPRLSVSSPGALQSPTAGGDRNPTTCRDQARSAVSWPSVRLRTAPMDVGVAFRRIRARCQLASQE